MNVTVTLLSKRFQKNHFERLVAALQLDAYTCHQRTVCPAAEALLILLRRLAYPNRWCELTKLFGRAEPELSMIFNEVCIMFNWYKYLHSCQEGSNKGYVQVPMTPVMGCKNWESKWWHFILRVPICFLHITPQEKILDVLLFNFSFNVVPYNLNHSGSRDPCHGVTSQIKKPRK